MTKTAKKTYAKVYKDCCNNIYVESGLDLDTKKFKAVIVDDQAGTLDGTPYHGLDMLNVRCVVCGKFVEFYDLD